MEYYDPAISLRHAPIPMERYGKNPFGENLFRIVFAPSRRNLVGNTDVGYRWVPTYRQLGDVWVLEGWQDAWGFSQCTREQWDRKLSILGPYPERGEYSHAFTFESCPPQDANLDKLISWVKEGSRRSFDENRAACQADYDLDTKHRQAQMEAITRNAYPAFGANAFAGGSVSRGTKHAPALITAEDVRLPSSNNKFVTLRGTE